MPKCNRIAFAFFLILASSVVCFCQSNGVVSGRVTIDGKGAANITVMLISNPDDGVSRKIVTTTTTDNEGNYRLTGLSKGKYRVMTYTPTLSEVNRSFYNPNRGKDVTLNEGEQIENIDFALKRGGVITGRVTDNEGQPVIGQQIFIESVDGNTRLGGPIGGEMYETDDRGIYRIYGLPEGNYLVSLGADNQTTTYGMKPRIYFTRTFHPATTDKSEAKVIELAEGEEETSVDITLGTPKKTYAFNGRVVDVDSNKPVANVNIAYGRLTDDGKRIGGYGSDTRSDMNGQFSVEGVKPGRYLAFVVFDDKSESRTSDAVPFEITDNDLNSMEIKVRKGSSINGVAVLEGYYGQSVLAKFAEVSITISNTGDNSTLSAPKYANTKIGADGNFHFNGLAAGRFVINTSYPQPKNFLLLRVEQNGVELKNRTIEIVQGADVSNVRLVFEYGGHFLRGKVNIEGTLPQDARVMATARKVGHPNTIFRYSDVDGRGQFIIEGLSTGEYDVDVIVTGLPKPKFVRQRVTVNTSETNLTITLNLNN